MLYQIAARGKPNTRGTALLCECNLMITARAQNVRLDDLLGKITKGTYSEMRIERGDDVQIGLLPLRGLEVNSVGRVIGNGNR